ncbi:hypothetical protein F5887DRAFT_1291628 [Amanita rubescens]|nr:hypothetical protein F5887DRAFT_1291628 [Amanita rubescens]
MAPGRPIGSKNMLGHSAGGSRAKSGRKPAQSTDNASAGPSVPSVRSSTLNTGSTVVPGHGNQQNLFSIFNRIPGPQRNVLSEQNIDATGNMTDMIDDLNLEQPFTFLNSVNPDTLLGSESDNEWDDIFESVNDFDDSVDDDLGFHNDDLPATGVVGAYLASVKDKLAQEISGNGIPLCYKNGTFWIVPKDGYFAMSSLRSSEGLTPESFYYPQNKDHPMTIKGWNSDPVAHRVVDLKDNYYIITQRFRCHRKTDASGPTGCGRTVNLYDPDILEQLDPGLVDEFPAFLTHRSGIDKTLMTLIRAGIAHRVSSRAWSKILQELHVLTWKE